MKKGITRLSNPYLGGDSDGTLLLLDARDLVNRYLVSPEGERRYYLNNSLLLKDAGLTLTEDTENGVLTLDCIPEPWKSRVIEYENKTKKDAFNG